LLCREGEKAERRISTLCLRVIAVRNIVLNYIATIKFLLRRTLVRFVIFSASKILIVHVKKTGLRYEVPPLEGGRGFPIFAAWNISALDKYSALSD
jgi:hypothetical protein